MICPDCYTPIDDDAEQCPVCGMYILDSEEENERVPRSFVIASILFGVVSLSVWGMVFSSAAVGGFIPLTLISPLIGYGLGKKGKHSVWPRIARAGVYINMIAVVIALGFIVLRAGLGESILWLEP